MYYMLEKVTGFDWYEGNFDKNLIKHDVQNWECEQVFFNKPLIILDDHRHSLVEKRLAAFGKTDGGRLLTMIFTIRKSLIRVISARDMNKKERIYYHDKAQ
ncbi:BrnT family toxin [Desulfonatronospira sp. MSAO_Bac3]|uniref:BrnT family toxin n=1 Tax=Desulfonatronospira sp. MSAO_Bac3 TaxID=2293857 RepID=UPI000FEE710B|nr:BrnT family toxin [Desulfonatronospira sp. MSAO_Bac3]RQD77720.1 MAG: BrnT family toxin [Desulfonatronospira sp. MSAO_Bac3]